jgi:peroxiredoxin Q/BCP
MLNEGDAAPDFTVRDEKGNEVKLADFRGERVALYFYPKDDTPGCTKQACSLRDSYANLTDKNIRILGVSLDDEASHQKFIGKFNLPFTLLADADHKLSESYGVYGEKNMYGKKYMGISRTTFLIDETGKIKKIIKKPNVEQHADEIIKAFDA